MGNTDSQRLDAMRRQRDGYRNQLRKTEQAVARVREVATGDPTEYGWSEAMLAVLRALDGETHE